MLKIFKAIQKGYNAYYINTILSSFFILSLIIYLTSKSYPDFLTFYSDWISIVYLFSVPFISILILKFFIDESSFEKEIKKNSSIIIIGVLTVITLILTLFNPTISEEVTYQDEGMIIEKFPSNLIEQKQIHYPMMYLIVCSLICYLSKHGKVKSIFALSSLILIFSLLLDIMNFKESLAIQMSRGYIISGWDVTGDGFGAFLLRFLKIALPFFYLYLIYIFIGKKKL